MLKNIGLKIRLLSIITLLTGLLLTACGDTPATTQLQVSNIDVNENVEASNLAQADNLIRVYSSLPLTGSSKDQSLTLVNAMQMALEDYGGVDRTVAGFKIDYISLDDATAKAGQWDKDQEIANAQKAVADPNAMVYIGTFNSGAAKYSIPILNAANLPMISPANTYPGLTRAVEGITEANEPGIYYPNKVRNYFRVVIGDDLQGPAVVSFAVNTLKANRFFLVDDSQTYGVGLADAVSRELKKRRLTEVGREKINGNENNYRDLARKIKASGADFIFFGGIAQQQPGKLLADIRASGVRAPFMGGDGINNPAFVKLAGVAGEDSYSSISGLPVDKLPAKGQDFLKRYQARFGTPTNYTIYSYEAMAVALTGIKTAGKKDRRAILDAIARTKNINGVLGNWNFDANGDTTQTDFSVYQIKDGLLVYLQSIQPGK